MLSYRPGPRSSRDFRPFVDNGRTSVITVISFKRVQIACCHVFLDKYYFRLCGSNVATHIHAHCCHHPCVRVRVFFGNLSMAISVKYFVTSMLGHIIDNGRAPLADML